MVLTTITSSVSSKGSIIVGNLMDNAIRGAVASDERRLSFQMYYGKGIIRLFLPPQGAFLPFMKIL